MTISVVIPAYNEEKYLPKTLTSIAYLSRKPDEVLIIDAQSTDKTPEIAKQFGAKSIIIPHRGIGYARQKGLEAASGDVIAFTDADTIVPHDWLTKIEQSLAKPNIVAVYSGYKVYDGWFPYRFTINYIHPLIFFFFHYIGFPIAPGQNTAFWKTKGFEAGGYPIDFKAAEDIEMIRRLKTVGKIIYRYDNYVSSSGRRGNEGFAFFIRMARGLSYYFVTRKANTFDFPDIR